MDISRNPWCMVLGATSHKFLYASCLSCKKSLSMCKHCQKYDLWLYSTYIYGDPYTFWKIILWFKWWTSEWIIRKFRYSLCCCVREIYCIHLTDTNRKNVLLSERIMKYSHLRALRALQRSLRLPRRDFPHSANLPLQSDHSIKMKNQSINTKVTYKICCSLCLTFDCKGHLRNHQMWSISYLTCKFWTKSFHKQQDTF